MFGGQTFSQLRTGFKDTVVFLFFLFFLSEVIEACHCLIVTCTGLYAFFFPSCNGSDQMPNHSDKTENWFLGKFISDEVATCSDFCVHR